MHNWVPKKERKYLQEWSRNWTWSRYYTSRCSNWTWGTREGVITTVTLAASLWCLHAILLWVSMKGKGQHAPWEVSRRLSVSQHRRNSEASLLPRFKQKISPDEPNLKPVPVWIWGLNWDYKPRTIYQKL